jgi:hypothetical protein
LGVGVGGRGRGRGGGRVRVRVRVRVRGRVRGRGRVDLRERGRGDGLVGELAEDFHEGPAQLLLDHGDGDRLLEALDTVLHLRQLDQRRLRQHVGPHTAKAKTRGSQDGAASAPYSGSSLTSASLGFEPSVTLEVG